MGWLIDTQHVQKEYKDLVHVNQLNMWRMGGIHGDRNILWGVDQLPAQALGLLQKELALQIGCSVTAVQKIERDERAHRAMAERLAEALDVRADERVTFVLVARGERLIERLLPISEPTMPIADLRPARRRVALPASPTMLFGRDMELAAISRLLHDPQCRS